MDNIVNNVKKHQTIVKGKYSLIGAFTFNTLSSLLEKLPINTHADIYLDCSKIVKIDSAGIALLLVWKQQTEKNNKQFLLENIPQQARKMIRANQLDFLLS